MTFEKKGYCYGAYFMGWMPAKGMSSGGRFCFFKSREAYFKKFKEEYDKERRKELDRMISAAGVCGGISRSKNKRRSF